MSATAAASSDGPPAALGIRPIVTWERCGTARCLRADRLGDSVYHSRLSGVRIESHERNCRDHRPHPASLPGPRNRWGAVLSPSESVPAALTAGVETGGRRPEGVGGVAGIELTFAGAPSARFRLLWDEAPATCEAVVAALPSSAECFHAAYSGTIAAFLLDPEVDPPLENSTTCVMPGDLLFTHYDATFRHGHHNALSEVYWAYDRHARPTIPGQLVPCIAVVFGAYDGTPDDWAAFAAKSKQLRFDGVAPVQISTY